jgi:hypothetical protein
MEDTTVIALGDFYAARVDDPDSLDVASIPPRLATIADVVSVHGAAGQAGTL